MAANTLLPWTDEEDDASIPPGNDESEHPHPQRKPPVPAGKADNPYSDGSYGTKNSNPLDRLGASRPYGSK